MNRHYLIAHSLYSDSIIDVYTHLETETLQKKIKGTPRRDQLYDSFKNNLMRTISDSYRKCGCCDSLVTGKASHSK